ncbi:MAG: chloride channel protein [Pseudobdellovibrio sp.]
MSNKYSNNNPYIQLLITLIFGGVIGLLTYAFVSLLNLIDAQQALMDQPYYLILAPLVMALIIFVKRNTLFFPTKVNEISSEVSSHYWSSIMAPAHFIGPLLSHLSGMSLGREGAVVLFSSGLVRSLKLSWHFWGPVFASIGFSSVIGNYWVAPVFMFELFESTGPIQKLMSFIGAVVAVLVTHQLEMPHLFSHYEFQDDMSFFSKFFFFFIFAFAAGLIMRYYKKLHGRLAAYFLKAQYVLPVMASVILAAALYLPEFRQYQSLGISQFSQLDTTLYSMNAALTKLAFTLISTCIGFMGGEFIPLVYSGTHFGGSFFQYFGHSSQLGGAFGAFMLFAAGTRLKWTTLFLMVPLLGFSWIFWIYYSISFAILFSGAESLYQKLRQPFL